MKRFLTYLVITALALGGYFGVSHALDTSNDVNELGQTPEQAAYAQAYSEFYRSVDHLKEYNEEMANSTGLSGEEYGDKLGYLAGASERAYAELLSVGGEWADSHIDALSEISEVHDLTKAAYEDFQMTGSSSGHEQINAEVREHLDNIPEIPYNEAP